MIDVYRWNLTTFWEELADPPPSSASAKASSCSVHESARKDVYRRILWMSYMDNGGSSYKVVDTG
jgi:hypothetical protein